MSDRQQQAKAIFLSLLEIDSPQQREAYLRQQCGGDAQLQTEVRDLLVHQEQLGGFLETCTNLSVATKSATNEFEEPRVIGPYTVREKLGEGGMGTVYVAEQTSPIRRKVAIKIIKPGMATSDVVARFEAERQALAMMDHPHIARVFDGGATSDGQPYFVMELVRGVPIVEFCDQQKLTLRERLELFTNVCLAVQHAHQKGIIHRDLKPSNVLVAEIDGRLVPKVIDFGVAKAIDQKLTDQTIYTQFAHMIGTPMYMSPEQAGLGVVDIDTRSDVYALGVLLYELLTGNTPFDRDMLKQGGFDEIRRIIREVEPLCPSAAVGTLRAQSQSTVAAARRSAPRKLCDGLRGELDWIVLKALEKDRSRRYESASELAQDIQRYLDDEPVKACPPSLGYRLRKYVKRRKTLLATVALVLLMMIASTAVSAWYALDAHSARLLADAESQRAREHADQARQLLYAGDLRLAGLAARRNDVERRRELLMQHVPVGEETDLRGFEWHFLWKQIEMRPRHLLQSTGPLYFVCFSPDKRLLAAAGQDAAIRVLDAHDFAVLATIESGQLEVNGLAFSPDCRLLASAGDDGNICLWDTADQRLVRRIKAYDSLAYQVVFTPDGKALASCGDDPRIRFWDVETGKRLKTIGQHDSVVECLSMARNGMLASGSADGTTVLTNLAAAGENDSTSFDPRNAQWVRGITNWNKGAVTCTAFSPDDALLAHGQKGGLLTLYDVPGGAVIARQILPDGIQSVAFCPKANDDALFLAAGDRGGNVHLLPVDWEFGAQGMITSLSESTELRQWKAHDSRVYALAFHPDGKRLVTAGEDGRLLLWNLETRHVRRTLCESHSDFALLDNERVVTLAPGLPVRSLTDGGILTFLTRRDSDWMTLHFATSADTVYAKSQRGEFFAWDASGAALGRIWSPPPGHNVGNSAVSPDGRILAVELIPPGKNAVVEIFDMHSKTTKARVSSGNVDLVIIGPQARRLAFEDENLVRIADVESGEIVHVLSGHRAAIRNIAFSPDGRFLATTSADRLLKVWDLQNEAEIWSVVAHENDMSALAFSHDGRTVATAGNDGLLRLWRWKVQRMVMEIQASGLIIRQLEFSPDDRRILATESSSLTVYDASPDDAAREVSAAPGA